MEATKAKSRKIAYPGARGGPCTDEICGHENCEMSRDIAASPCTLCRKVIGYATNYVDDRSPAQIEAQIVFTGFTHTHCKALQRRVEQKRQTAIRNAEKAPRKRQRRVIRNGYIEYAERPDLRTNSAVDAVKRKLMPMSAAERLQLEAQGIPIPKHRRRKPGKPKRETPADSESSTT